MGRMTPAEIVAWLREQAAGAPTDLACERLGAAADLIERQVQQLEALRAATWIVANRADDTLRAAYNSSKDLHAAYGAFLGEEESRG